VYLVVYTGTERRNKVWVGGVEGLAPGDVGKEIFPYELVLGAPNFPSFVVEDGVEVRVHRGWVSAWRSHKKVWKEIEVNEDFVVGGNRLYGGGGDWGWAPNDVFGRWVTEGGSGRTYWEDGGDGRRDVFDFLNEREVFDDPVEKGSVGGDIGEKVQRLVLNVVELVASDSEKGIKEEAGWWGRDVVVEERRSWGENVLTWEEHVLIGSGRVVECALNGGSGGVEVGLVGETYFGPSG